MIYISFLETEKHYNENRIIFRSSLGVIDYMADVLSRIEPVDIISPIRTKNKSGFIKGRKEQYADSITLSVPPTFGCKTKIGRFFAVAWTQLWLLLKLLTHAKKDEPVVVYHSLSIIKTVALAKAIKRFKLVLEIREVYADVYNNANTRKKENAFFKKADSYIFATQVLNDIINIDQKPYVIASGVYKPSAQAERLDFDRLNIHVVYAGTFTIAKGGALMAAKVAEFLPENYHVHILGKGSDIETEAVINEVKRVSEISSAKLTYDGCFMGDAFRSYLQSCDIGLSTQDISGDFGITSFPSKILTYLSNGLQVVAGRIPAVETSGVDPYVVYYDENDPKSIAKTVINLKNNNIDVRSGLLELDKSLEESLRKLLISE